MANLFFNLKELLSSTDNFQILTSRDFWRLAINISNNLIFSSFPLLLQPDGSTAASSFSGTKHFAQPFTTNSTLDDTGHIPPTPPSSDYFIQKF